MIKKNNNKKIYIKLNTNKITGWLFETTIILYKIKQNKSWKPIKNKTNIKGENWKKKIQKKNLTRMDENEKNQRQKKPKYLKK